MSEKLNFIVIDDSKLDCFIAEKVIQNSGRSETVKSFMVATEALDYIMSKSSSDTKTVVLGENGIIQLLRNAGYLVEAVK